MANEPMAGDTLLDIPAEQMRTSGYRVIDMLVERFASLEGGPVWQSATRAELESRLRQPSPQDPESLDRILEQLAVDVLPFAGRIDHPRFMAFVAGSGTWPGILGDLIASGFNIFQGTWLASAGPSQVELIVLDWFKEWLSYPPEASGILLSGGSAANLTALACAREVRFGAHSPDAVIYTSVEAHSSVERAARILGFARERVRSLPTDAEHRLDATQLAQAVEADVAHDLTPFCVIANGGATSTGAVDPLDAIANVAQQNGLWFHVDGAYGGFAVLTGRGREVLKGIERADSITLDPHKWLYQPFEVGCLLVRNGTHLRDSFHIMPDYLQDTAVGNGAVNFADRGIQLTRMSRALKIWMSLKHFGVPAFTATIDRCLDLTERAAELIRHSDRLELLAGPALSIVCFRRRVTGSPEHADQANVKLLEQLRENGVGMISSTRVNGVYALRLCIVNHRTSWRDVEPVLRWLEQQPVG